MILHEKIHIRLGHLWFYFLWDLLRCLLWPNPFLTLCTGYFRQDLEDIGNLGGASVILWLFGLTNKPELSVLAGSAC
ncbi:hypothetical protein E5329_00165 [Petralouisia muris]|uniref:Uncharacterized protein n=1 Tax=Petralouisia muris TaxID=3032872 RepID=A0AC61S1T2_9FIRM|nr:hypothetical protein E5329_00165 [Petralouisia muris]